MNGLIRCRGHWGPPPCEGGGGAFNLSAFSRLIDIPERSRLHLGILGIGNPEEEWRWQGIDRRLFYAMGTTTGVGFVPTPTQVEEYTHRLTGNKTGTVYTHTHTHIH